MISEYNNITLNGKLLIGDDLISLCYLKLSNSELPEWERNIYEFILEWQDENEFVWVNTSGSTGTPKSIRILKNRMIASALMTGKYLDLKKNDNALLCLPAKFIAGKMMIVRAIVLKLNLIVIPPDSFPVKELSHDIGFAAMVPLQVQNSITNKYNFNRIKKLIIGGSSISNDLINKLQFVKPDCYSTFGMTETITHIAMRRLNNPTADEYFSGLDDVQFGKNENNCLTIFAPNICDELIVTNDVIELIDESQFKWLGRRDHVINSGGIKLHPERIEAKLSEKIFRRFFIYGLKDPDLGEKVALFIEGRPLDGECYTRFEERINKLLDRYEKPKEIIHLPLFEETETGKVKRKSTVDKYLSSLTNI
ncbi:MAG: AMP-binding protein [Bacteroidales bacterium]|nr:AMP-binding protein [Bacteroidales bacterium]